MYGCEGKGHEGRKLQEQIFPLLLHKNAPEKVSILLKRIINEN